MADDFSALEYRLRRLERQNRLLVVAVVGLVAFGFFAASDSTGPTKASAFQLTDDSGNVRAELAIRDGGVGLFIKDAKGNDRLRATHEPAATGVFLNDEDGTTRIGIAQFAHGGGGVALHGPESKGAAVLYFKGQGSLRFFDAEGSVTNQVLAAGPKSP